MVGKMGVFFGFVWCKEKRARMEQEAEGRAIDYKIGRTYNQPRVKGLSAEENEWIEARARALANEKLEMRNEKCGEEELAGQSVKEVVRKPVTLNIGEAMKEESEMDYYTMWQERQERGGERLSKY